MQSAFYFVWLNAMDILKYNVNSKNGADMSSFGKRIKYVMLKRGMTQQSLASKLKISVQQLSSILKDKSLSTIVTLRELSIALDTPSDYFLQDFDKRFIVYAIDDYLSKIDRDYSQKVIENISAIIGDEDEWFIYIKIKNL